jgi:hypothetical protein
MVRLERFISRTFLHPGLSREADAGIAFDKDYPAALRTSQRAERAKFHALSHRLLSSLVAPSAQVSPDMYVLALK